MGMAADSKHEDECWVFLRGFYLNPRTYTMSVIQGSLEQSIQRELHQLEEEGNAAYWPHAEADMRLFADAFTGATVLYRHDDAVWEIVQAEANRYFAGQISAEECAKAIQSRASIYLLLLRRLCFLRYCCSQGSKECSYRYRKTGRIQQELSIDLASESREGFTGQTVWRCVSEHGDRGVAGRSKRCDI